MEGRIKILFVSQMLPPEDYSGIPIITWTQAVSLRKIGHLVHCLCATNSREKHYHTVEVEDVKIHYVPQYSLSTVSPSRIIQNKFKESQIKKFVASLLKTERYDIIHINDMFCLHSKIMVKLREHEYTNSKLVREFWFYEDVCFRQNLIVEAPKKVENGKERMIQEVCSGPESVEKCINCYFKTYSSEKLIVDLLKRRIVPVLIKKQFKDFQKELDRYSALIFPCEELEKFFLSIPSLQFRKPTYVIPHGIAGNIKSFKNGNARRIVKYEGGPVNFIFLGAIYNIKGIGLVLNAFEKLAEEKTPPFRLYIAGLPCDDHYIRKISYFSSIYPEKITYLGTYIPEEIPRIIQENNIHVGIVPSFVETYSRVLRELLSNSVPVIATDFIGSELIKDNVNGFRISVGDSNALYQKMKMIIEHPEIINPLSEGAYYTKITSAEEEAQLLVSCYSHVIGKNS